LDAFEKNASAINLIYNRKGWEAPHTGMDFFGRSGPLGILNHVTPNLVFRDVRKYVEGVTKNVELIVHYTNHFSGLLIWITLPMWRTFRIHHIILRVPVLLAGFI
jgi:hypothetical protein